MKLFTSNRLENLLDILALQLQNAPLPPLQTETIVVQSQGMERWLCLELAQRLGIWANAAFPFPGVLSWNLFRACVPGVTDTSLYDPAFLQWSIAALLPQCLPRTEFAELRAYLHADHDGLKRAQLARRIADTFDQYIIFRPDWIQAWEQQPLAYNDWQQSLWNEINQRYAPLGATHRADLWQRLLQQLQNPRSDRSRLPPRLSIFGITSLPPFYIEIFSQLARHIPVSLYILNPCREYWGLVRSDAEIARISARNDLNPEEEYLETGNPLLASLGRLGRDFLDQLLDDYHAQQFDYFSESQENTLLARVQRDILNLYDSSAVDTDKYLLEPHDTSLQIHNCHSPMREVEVLHDRLLALFAHDNDLTAADVLVMMPDIESYAALIQAVFATVPDATRQIPFSIADRDFRRENILYDIFFTLLDVADGRLGLNSVIALLQAEAVQARFGLSASDVKKIRDWLNGAGIRWGVNAADRLRYGVPEFDENTWEAGLHRLLLGYALPGDNSYLFENILPFDEIEGSDALCLGKLLSFTQALFATRAELQQPAVAEVWAQRLSTALDKFLSIPATAAALQRQMQGLRNACAHLHRQTAATGFTEPLSLAVIRFWLQRTLADAHSPGGFITGGVTFCAMLPMRSIPFKVVCVIGLHDRAYPRRHKAPGFDLMSQKPRRGDRSRRNDDRYLFLEALLSARRYLYLSYAGQSIQDNSEVPPSVLVSELVHYLEQSCFRADGTEVIQQLRIRHPLQAFSRRYFDRSDSALFSYNHEYCTALAQQGTALPAPFFSAPLAAEEVVEQVIELDELVRFFSNPARYLLEKRLKIRLRPLAALLEDSEPLALNRLDYYQLDVHLLHKWLRQGILPASHYPLLKAAGRLSPGQVGRHQFALLCDEVTAFHARLQPFLSQENIITPQSVQVHLGEYRVSGFVAHEISPQQTLGYLSYRPADVKAKDLLALWLHHLFTQAVRAHGYNSVHIGRDRIYHLPPISDSHAHLHTLVELYQHGMREPLPFFPESAWCYVAARHKQKSPSEALHQAQQVWRGNLHQAGEHADLYYQRCFGAMPLDHTFSAIAEKVCLPLVQVLT
jgi:exodeoxyribonuclease V gamma subunit